MREPKVLFIYPPNQLMNIETARPDGSLGPLYLAGALRQIGIEPELLDMTVGTEEDTLENTFYRGVVQSNNLIKIGMSWERIRSLFERGQYDIVAINSNFTPQTKMAFKVAKIAKEVNPKTLVISGGTNARHLANRFFTTGDFDLICTTDGEQVIQEVVERFRNGQRLPGIPGTKVLSEGKIYPTPAGPILQNLDELPFPAYSLLPFTKYERIASAHGVNIAGKLRRYAPIMTSRGCPFQCEYCHISLERFGRSQISGDVGNLRLKSVKRVLQEIEILRGLGVTKLFFEDDSLLAKMARVKEIFTALLTMGLTIADVNGVNLVHLCKPTVGGKLTPNVEYMQLLYDAGFQQIVFPVESGSQRILKKYATDKLDHERMDVIELVRAAVRIGILCPVNMMIGFPHETEEEMMVSVDMAKRLIDAGAPYVTFFIPIPFPGCKLHTDALRCPDCRGSHLSPDYDTDIFNWKNGVMVNTTVPIERTIEIRDWAWETVNPPEHVAQRLQDSIGARRWTYNYDNEG